MREEIGDDYEFDTEFLDFKEWVVSNALDSSEILRLFQPPWWVLQAGSLDLKAWIIQMKSFITAVMNDDLMNEIILIKLPVSNTYDSFFTFLFAYHHFVNM